MLRALILGNAVSWNVRTRGRDRAKLKGKTREELQHNFFIANGKLRFKQGQFPEAICRFGWAMQPWGITLLRYNTEVSGKGLFRGWWKGQLDKNRWEWHASEVELNKASRNAGNADTVSHIQSLVKGNSRTDHHPHLWPRASLREWHFNTSGSWKGTR